MGHSTKFDRKSKREDKRSIASLAEGLAFCLTDEDTRHCGQSRDIVVEDINKYGSDGWDLVHDHIKRNQKHFINKYGYVN